MRTEVTEVSGDESYDSVDSGYIEYVTIGVRGLTFATRQDPEQQLLPPIDGELSTAN